MNRVIYDWLTFTSKIHSLPDVIEFLGLSDVKFDSFRGRYCYQDRLHYDGINILFNGHDDMGICVEMSGQGCRSFETYGNGDYENIFEMVSENYSYTAEERQANISRLDIAYDDFDGVLDLKYYMSAAQNFDYVSRLKDIEVIFSNKGCSVCHGSRLQSNVYIRMYDKKMEKGRTDLDHWIRCELKLRDETALGFIKLDGDIRENYFNVLNNYLRSIVHTEDSNKRRAPASPQWLNFIETWETVSIFDKPGVEYNLSNLDGFVNNQLSGALTTYIDVVGVENFLKNITESRKGKQLNPKYSAIRSKYDESSDSIKEFLNKRNVL